MNQPLRSVPFLTALTFILGMSPAFGTPCIINEDCAPTEYCAKAWGECTGIGSCEPVPFACPEGVWSVCGCDGASYPSACFAAQFRTNVNYYGLCGRPAPSWIIASDDLPGMIRLSWEDVEGELGYFVYRFDFGIRQLIGTTPPDVTSFDDHEVCAGVQYVYYTTASFPAGESSYSPFGSGWALNQAPVALAGGTYSVTAGNGVVLDGQSSYDPDEPCDSIAAYAWDTDGDGLFNVNGGTVTLEWPDIVSLICRGTCLEGIPYPLLLQVTDSHGAAGTNLAFLTVNPPEAPVRLLSPNGGEMFGNGESYPLLWVARPDVDFVNLYYAMSEFGPWQFITRLGRDAGGSYEWTVPTLPRTSHTAMMKVAAYAGRRMVGRDTSDGFFSLGPVEVLSPGDGDILAGGTDTPISWNTYRTARTVWTTEIRLSTNGGASWRRVGLLYGNPGTYNWTVPLYPESRGECLIKIVHRNRFGMIVGSGMNRGLFTISR